MGVPMFTIAETALNYYMEKYGKWKIFNRTIDYLYW
jgi:hypothetical protein